MGRILFLLIIAFLVYLLFKGFLRAQTRRSDEETKTEKVEDMVACARCGVNLPKSEARTEGELFYCRENPRCIAGP